METVPKVFTNLAHKLGTELTGNRLEIPSPHGSGYCAGYVFNEHMRLMILNYKLKHDLAIENPDVDFTNKMILFKFQNVISEENISLTGKKTPSVLIATSSLNTEQIIPIHSASGTLNIEVNAGYLGTLLVFPERSAVLQSLLKNTQPLLFEEVIFPSLQHIVDEILAERIDQTFELFFLRIKSEELVCRLLMELEKRQSKQLQALNTTDIEKVYWLKERMLSNLSTPPVIEKIAVEAQMSPSKLKRVFKQIFGDSIFSYYQQFRMKEAARMLREQKMSVSEVGYVLGFTNLSHFSRVFHEHIGSKPKQYSRA